MPAVVQHFKRGQRLLMATIKAQNAKKTKQKSHSYWSANQFFHIKKQKQIF